MSEQTLAALVQAAKAFKNDTSQLPALRDALAAHDADEAPAATQDATPDNTSAGGTTDVTVTDAPDGTTVTP